MKADIDKYRKLSQNLILSNHHTITYTDSRGPTVIITETDSFYAIVITKADIIQQKTTSRWKAGGC